ncbi:hypothetical protein [Caballeronia sp. Lep1P3]|uniref:hypothetical protein n=1 Tax=Caballeronia sp. Lep1P3 TaxID=2878150 RepID=UPI001FD113E0|nr:hypothetical protein [Caballeronia sp. Lep1P3]
MTLKNRISTLSLASADYLLTDMRTGIISRAIHSESPGIVIYVLKTGNGAQYYAQFDYLQYRSRNDILLAALEAGLTVTLRADANHDITDVAATLPPSVPLPALGMTWRLLEDVRTGAVVQVEEADSISSIAYIVRSPDGSHHCAQLCTRDGGYRDTLLMAALRARLPVTVAGDADYYLTAVSVGSKGFGPHISSAPGFVSGTPRSGLIDEIIDRELHDTLSVVVKTPEGTRYHAEIDRQEHANRNHLLMMSLRSALPVTVCGNDEHYITGVAVGASSAGAAPPLILFGLKLTETRAGAVVRIVDSDTLDDVRYVLRTPDGTHYCARMNTTKHASRHRMLMTALALNLPVSIAANGDSAITGVAVGLPRGGMPGFRCEARRFAGTRKGRIVRMIDFDALGADVVYVLQTADGDEYGLPAFTRSQPGRAALLGIALLSELTVTATGGKSEGRESHAASLIVERG